MKRGPERERERENYPHSFHCNLIAIVNDYFMITVENFLDYWGTFKVRKPRRY